MEAKIQANRIHSSQAGNWKPLPPLQAIGTVKWSLEFMFLHLLFHCEPQWPDAGGIFFSFVDLGTGYAGKVP